MEFEFDEKYGAAWKCNVCGSCNCYFVNPSGKDVPEKCPMQISEPEWNRFYGVKNNE